MLFHIAKEALEAWLQIEVQNTKEIKKFLKDFGYEESDRRKTSGSRVAFVNVETKHIIRLHKPHPGNELKLYQLDQIREELAGRGLI